MPEAKIPVVVLLISDTLSWFQTNSGLFLDLLARDSDWETVCECPKSMCDSKDIFSSSFYRYAAGAAAEA